MRDELESARIALLVARDGLDAARSWVERTREIYRSALASSGSHATTPEFRRGFEASIATFDQWLAENA